MSRRFMRATAHAVVAAAAVLTALAANPSLAEGSAALDGQVAPSTSSAASQGPRAPSPAVRPATPRVPATALSLPPAIRDLKVFHSVTGATPPPDLSRSRPPQLKLGRSELDALMGSPPASEVVLTPSQPYAKRDSLEAKLVALAPRSYAAAEFVREGVTLPGYILWDAQYPGLKWRNEISYESLAIGLRATADKTYVIDVALLVDPEVDQPCQVLVWGPAGPPSTNYPCPKIGRDGYQHIRFVYAAERSDYAIFSIGAQNYRGIWEFRSATIAVMPGSPRHR